MKKEKGRHQQKASASLQPTRRAMELTNLRDARCDPQGSYTGQPVDPRENPVQDADDL